MYKLTGTSFVVMWSCLFGVLWMLGTGFSVPTPIEVISALDPLLKNGLLFELWVSLRLNIEALIISSMISVMLAYVSVELLFSFPVRAVSKFRFFGLAGFVVIFMRVFGGGHAMKVALLVFGISVFFVTSMLDVVGSATRDELDHARSLGMSRMRLVIEVIVLGKADLMFDALRQNAAIGWMMLTMVEGLAKSEGGVGVIMLEQIKYRNLAVVFAIQLVVLAVGIVQDVFIVWLKNTCCPHVKLVVEKKP